MPDSIRCHDFPFHAFTTMCIRSSKIKNLLRSALCACRTALVALKRALSEVKRLFLGSPNELANEDAQNKIERRSAVSPSIPSTRVTYHRILRTLLRVKYYQKHISHCII